MSHRIIIWIVFFVLVLSGSGTADIYKYYDDNGVLCITDDISRVPEDQRKAVEKSKEINTPMAQDSDYQIPKQTSESTAVDEQLQQQMKKEHDRLIKVRKELDSEFSQLKERRDALVQEQDSEMSPEALENFNLMARNLNDDTLIYKKKKEDYLKAVEAYNQKFEQAGL